MSDQSPSRDKGHYLALVLAFILVMVGLINTMPEIPGLQDLARDLTGRPFFRVSGFPPEFFYPPIFLVMMVIVALDASVYRALKKDRPHLAWLGLLLDAGLILAAFLAALGFLVEIDSFCLIDQITGERARLIQEASERSAGLIPGISFEAEVPSCQARFGIWIIPLLFTIISLFFLYNVRVWGLPLVMVATVVVVYTVGTALLWMFDLSDNNFLLTKLGADGGDARAAAIQKATNVFITPDGFMGRFMDIVVNQVFPYVILGALFGTSAGGTSLIKLAVRATRRLRGGPAHAAIVSSAMFGTITGGPVTNVLSTGRLTIPMMRRNGFSPQFAGGVEAAASSGGQIMPPVMGVAAFVLVALTAVPYTKVITAAFLPAMFFFFSIFLAVVFQARRENVKAMREIPGDLIMSRQDWLNLIIIFAPIFTILSLLLGNKDVISSGFVASVLPAFVTQTLVNATGDAVSAGWWAVAVLVPLLFLDPETRAKPSKILLSLADGGILVSRLFLLLFAVSIISAFLNESGLTGELTRAITTWLEQAQVLSLFGFDIKIVGGVYLMLALTCAMGCAILLGMGMPTVPAYVNVALLLGPLLANLGVSFFTAHMFVFYFAVASAITPPVAIAAFAAASITRTEPMRTGLAAVRIGIVMFTIPFVFAWYPELLLIEEAVTITNDQGQRALIDGYSGSVDWPSLSALGLRIAVALYLMASALAKFDKVAMNILEVALRLLAAVLILWKSAMIMWIGLALALMLILGHYLLPLRGDRAA
ncbi:TRAP transporter fused permease subunit [Planktomarina temperata]|jgi:TRAP transporter 4TM/12TM fusion protein|uniref:TRAP transporter, 4TM/12TM fusion protein n=6 Tax=Planktomarina TaxID=1284657 RepID=A0AAN0RLD5_9RHOB|nr:TRAP transporter, 4TM/12TM fusion protein [Planktomarina temperata RCA23]MBL6849034.1 TRAP transporter fused permease subunit [Planktomarina temperata]MDA9349832.1 TRAP transporter fused permease subunit [bacterium]MDA8860508.1 TRAP transporter fused permease subunit [Planktomarina temperata]MDB0044808.1 TRAP transporter fused permease subunit [Planktomarina temperata]